MNIFIGKIGKSILFNRNSWGPIGGDNEAAQYYENLFAHNPEHTFYILGCNDLARCTPSEQARINAHNNVVNIWDKGFAVWRKANPMHSDLYNMKYVEWYVKHHNIKFDTGIVMAGCVGTSNIPGLSTKMKNPTVLTKPLMMLTKYSAPLIYFVNENRHIPYILIINDPRFFPPTARDWMHPPELALSQYTENVGMKIRKDYHDNTVRVHDIKCTYSAMETIFLIGRNDSTSKDEHSLDSFFENDDVQTTIEKDINFMVVLNEGRPSRYNLLKESILDHVSDVSIYGKWNEETIKDDKRFKGSIPFQTLQDMLPRVKYTFCIPIKYGWCTMKFWEMLHYGIIPFLHPSYDTQDNLKVPEFIRVTDSKDLFNKIKFLEENPEAYATLQENLKKLLKPEYYDGTALNKITFDAIKSIM